MELLEPRLALAGLALTDFYTEGKGSGLSLQQLEGFGLVTTYSTIIDGSTARSALQGNPTDHVTADSPVREGFEFNPAFIFDDPTGNLVGWNTELGGTAPWLIRPELVGQPGAAKDLAYPTRLAPDSAGTATTLYSGQKTFRGAIGVDIFEQPALSILEQAQELGKSTGTVSSVPISHATPAAAVAHHNARFNRDAAYPSLNNTLQQALRETKPTVMLGGGHPIIGRNSYVQNATLESLRDPVDGRYDEWTLVEPGPGAAERLAETALGIDPEAGQHLVGIFGARGQGGNLPWASADGDFSTTGTRGRLAMNRPLQEGELREDFIARELDENPRLYELTTAALEVLGKDEDGFWLVVEGGDIDWAMHENDIDDAVGAVLEFDLAVQSTIDWIESHGGFAENLLIVTADHDHYLTLNADFPELAAARGLADLMPTDLTDVTGDPQGNGHYWGANPNIQFGWASHSMIPVPIFYQGPSALMDQLENLAGEGFVAYDQPVSGVEGMIDQVHIHQVMSSGLADGVAKNVILMIGDAMGWEIVRAASIAQQVQPDPPLRARIQPSGQLVISGTRGADDVRVTRRDDVVIVQSSGQIVPLELSNGRHVDQMILEGRNEVASQADEEKS